MADYVQVRFETCSSPQRQINHDFRLSKVSYLRDNMFHNRYKNLYMKYDSNIVKQKVKKSYNEYNKIFRENHKRKHGNYRNLTKGKQSDFLSGIITLSPSINEKLKNKELTKTQLEKYFRQAIKNIQLEIKKAIGEDIELFYSVLHYDEKTPHLHFAFANHTKEGYSVHMKLKQYGRSKFQDIVGEAFKEINFKRGKRRSTARHMKVVEMHKAELNDLENQIKKQIKELQSKKKELKKSSTNITKLKVELDSIDKAIKTARLSLKDKETDVNKLTEQKAFLEEKIKDLEPIDDDYNVYSIQAILDYVSQVKKIEVKKGLLKSEQQTFTLLDKDKLVKILKPYNEKLLEVKNTPLINQKALDNVKELKEQLSVSESKKNSYFGINTALNKEVKELKLKIQELEDKYSNYEDYKIGYERMDAFLTKISNILECEDEYEDIENSVLKLINKETTNIRKQNSIRY